MNSNCFKFLLSQRVLSKLLKSASPNCQMINFKSSEVNKSYLIHLAWVWRGTVYLRLKCFYYQLNKAPLNPGSTQNPHIPILVGGNGEKRTLRTCAKSGDIFNLDFWHPGGVDVFKHFESERPHIVEKHCESFNRDPAEVKDCMPLPFRLFDSDSEWQAKKEASMPWYCWGTANAIQDLLGAYIDAGAQEIMLCAIPNKPEAWQRVEEEVLSAFD